MSSQVVVIPPALWTIYKGDIGIILQATINTVAGVVKDLTGLTATLKVWTGNNPATLIINEAITVAAPATNGIVQWTVSSADQTALDVNLAGYNAQIVLTASGYQSHTNVFTIRVLQAA